MASGGGKVLVTGASGYIATHVVKQLLQGGYNVRGTVRSLKNEKKVKPLQELCPEAKESLELVEADLLKPDSWLPAVQGCQYVMHVASPFPVVNPKSDDELIKPAVEGTLSVLTACKAAGTVKRVVLTSSVASVAYTGGYDGKVFTEQDWTDENDMSNTAYIRSKAKAERAAWKFVEELGEGEKFELAVINPGYVMGPVMCRTFTTSMEVPKRLMHHEIPLLPKLSFAICDVRDVAAAHINAMNIPEAAGHRHIVSNGSLWMHQIAEIVQKEFRPQGYNIPTKIAPKFMIRVASFFDKTLRIIVPIINRETIMDNSRLVNVLGVSPIPLKKTIIDMCYSMIEAGHIKKTSKYKPQAS